MELKLCNGTVDIIMDSERQPSQDSGHEYLIVLPFIVLFGLFGNVVSLVAIFHSRLRKMAANQYLIVLTIADSVFLLGIILVLFKVDYSGYIPCVLVEYLLMTASYVSSWSIAALTLERYMAIAHPLRHVQYGHMSRWKLMACWVPVPFLLNLVQFVTLTPSPPNEPNERKCGISDGGRLQLITELADVVLCYVFPCCTVVVLNAIIVSKVRLSEKRFFRSNGASCAASPTPPIKKSYCSMNSLGSRGTSARRPSPKASVGESAAPANGSGEHGKQQCTTRQLQVPTSARTTGSASGGSTRILLVVPVVYILLNTPFYLFRILDTVALNVFSSTMFQGDGLSRNAVLAWCYNAAHYLYYVNFACDVIVYAFSSANFRRSVVIVWHRILCSRWHGKQDDIRQNNTQNGVGGSNSLAYQLSTKRLLVKSQSNYNSQANNNNNLSRPGSGQRVSLEVEEGMAPLVVAKRSIAGPMAPEDSD